MLRRIAIVGGGVSGLGVAWALDRHPNRFDFRLFEAQGQIGGNAITADMPQDDGSLIPFDISVTACIPSVYQHMLLLMEKFGIDLIDTRFSYSVRYRGDVYAHDFDSEITTNLEPPASVWLVEPLPVEVSECPQPFQLRQHGYGSESWRIFWRLQI